MKRILAIVGFVGLVAGAAQTAEPDRFYFVSQFFSDNGALFYYRVFEVMPEGGGSAARYVRVAPANVQCPRHIVQADRTTVPDKRPADIVRSYNLCGIQPRDVEAAVRRYRKSEGVFEAISFGLVAQCGSSSNVFRLPMEQTVDLERMRRERPHIAHLWDLPQEVHAAFTWDGGNFNQPSDEEDLVQQRAGEELLPELRSGVFDAGLKAAVSGNVGTWKSPSFRSLLEDYRGPLTRKQIEAALTPRLVNAEAFSFARFSAPSYPPIARQARVQGNVDMLLTVQPDTGEVTAVSEVRGHPMLRAGAEASAKSWRFTPGSLNSSGVRLTLEFSLQCP